MSDHDITHREIYDRLLQVEQKVGRIEANTEAVVAAFNAAAGAFKVLETMGKVAKPLLWVGGLFAAFTVAWSNWKAS